MPRCIVCGSGENPHICGSSRKLFEEPSGGGGNGERIRQMDKIIQIAVSESGTIYGLSESGKTYSCFRGKWEIVSNSPKE